MTTRETTKKTATRKKVVPSGAALFAQQEKKVRALLKENAHIATLTEAVYKCLGEEGGRAAATFLLWFQDSDDEQRVRLARIVATCGGHYRDLDETIINAIAKSDKAIDYEKKREEEAEKRISKEAAERYARGNRERARSRPGNFMASYHMTPFGPIPTQPPREVDRMFDKAEAAIALDAIRLHEEAESKTAFVADLSRMANQNEASE